MSKSFWKQRRTIALLLAILVVTSIAAYEVYAALTFTVNTNVTVNPAPVVAAQTVCPTVTGVGGAVACSGSGPCSGSSTITCSGVTFDVRDNFTIVLTLTNFPNSPAPLSCTSGSAVSVTNCPATIPVSSGSGSQVVTVTGASTGSATVSITVT